MIHALRLALVMSRVLCEKTKHTGIYGVSNWYYFWKGSAGLTGVAFYIFLFFLRSENNTMMHYLIAEHYHFVFSSNHNLPPSFKMGSTNWFSWVYFLRCNLFYVLQKTRVMYCKHRKGTNDRMMHNVIMQPNYTHVYWFRASSIV